MGDNMYKQCHVVIYRRAFPRLVLAVDQCLCLHYSRTSMALLRRAHNPHTENKEERPGAHTWVFAQAPYVLYLFREQ